MFPLVCGVSVAVESPRWSVPTGEILLQPSAVYLGQCDHPQVWSGRIFEADLVYRGFLREWSGQHQVCLVDLGNLQC